MSDVARDTRTPISVERAAWAPWLLLGVGVAAVSASAIFVRYAADAHPLAISFWRCIVGALVLAPFARRDLGSLDRRSRNVSLVAGIFLAAHFGTWIWSVELTTIAAAVLLLATTPIFVAVAARLWLGERLRGVGWIGIAFTVAGAAAIGGADLGGSNLTGNVLALIGGATAGGYTIAGQVARRDLGIIGYSVITYSVAAVVLLLACLIADAPLWGYGAQTWWAIAAIVVGPQLLGHTILNLVVKELEATMISVAIMAEPLIATSLAYVLFDEVPGALVYPAGIAVLVGIYLVSNARRSREPVAAA
jgi:drug/metabolite transporter (DMT)-like permease